MPNLKITVANKSDVAAIATAYGRTGADEAAVEALLSAHAQALADAITKRDPLLSEASADDVLDIRPDLEAEIGARKAARALKAATTV